MKKNNISVLEQINYLYKLAIKFPENKSFIKKIVNLTNHNQIKLGKLKRTICFKCNKVLILNKNLLMNYIKKESGFGLSRKCTECQSEKFYVFRNKK
ncbi:hypothetical protein HERIO_1369 [Hepatospora eriocheir]|uniref:RPR2 n=1 Tax=Hepatospora eriocheir TaxID=1081669 RepID=A0A1X0QAE6_9MICR|nr:hypothetical protein HERIO_1369 [Hepatospora eriocheir]